MTYNWEDLTKEEKDFMIANEVLCFEKLNDAEGMDWYTKHYKMGFWRYSTELEDAEDLSKRVFGCVITDQLKECNGVFECKTIQGPRGVIELEEGFTSESIPDLICQLAVYVLERNLI